MSYYLLHYEYDIIFHLRQFEKIFHDNKNWISLYIITLL